MKLNNQRKINTKKKALKLIYDPTSLFRLLYSKYGDIEEDYELFHINQLIYESSSHYNIIFKELEIFLCKLLNLDKAKDFLPTEFIISSLKDKMLQCLNIINIKYFYKYFISLLRQRIEFKVLDSISEKLVNNENKI